MLVTFTLRHLSDKRRSTAQPEIPSAAPMQVSEVFQRAFAGKNDWRALA